MIAPIRYRVTFRLVGEVQGVSMDADEVALFVAILIENGALVITITKL